MVSTICDNSIQGKCYIEGCDFDIQYTIEWYGLDQYGNNPIVVWERHICCNPLHLLRASYHEMYGGFPDGVTDFETHEREHPEILEEIVGAMEALQPHFSTAV